MRFVEREDEAMRRFVPLTMALLTLALSCGALSCAAFKNDRCYVAPERYEQAKLLYNEVGSLKLVKEILGNEGWRAAEIRQVEYQLAKEFHLENPDEPRQAADSPRQGESSPGRPR